MSAIIDVAGGQALTALIGWMLQLDNSLLIGGLVWPAELLFVPAIACGISLAAATIPATGAGHFSANSPFAPIEERSDVLPWSVLTNVKTKVEKNAVVPVYPNSVIALDQKSQRVQGYMMPLDPARSKSTFY